MPTKNTMRAIIQRVKSAKVRVAGQKIAEIGKGILVFIGIKNQDNESVISHFVDKIINLRIFPNEQGKFDRAIQDIQGEILLVSQFTLYGDCSKGRRPSFTDAASPQDAELLYHQIVKKFHDTGLRIAEGQFQAMMEVELINDGPVTLILEYP